MKRLLFFLILLLMVPAVLSCVPLIGEASADLVKQRLAGKSYTGPQLTDNQLEGNFMVLTMLTAGEIGQAIGGSISTDLDPLGYAAPDPDNFFTSDRFALMTGLQLIGKGGKLNDFGGTDRVNLLYLEVPVYALYRHELPGKGLVFGGLGPYFGYGLTGKYKSTFNGQTTSFNAFDKNNGGLRRFDGGLAFTAGYQLPSSLQFRLAYELGLANIETGPGNKTTNRALSVSVGYSLNKLFGKEN